MVCGSSAGLGGESARAVARACVSKEGPPGLCRGTGPRDHLFCSSSSAAQGRGWDAWESEEDAGAASGGGGATGDGEASRPERSLAGCAGLTGATSAAFSVD